MAESTDIQTINAVTCFQSSPLDGTTKLARLVLRAAEKRLPTAPVAVYLDEALGEDANLFAGAGVFLPGDLAIVVLRGASADCARLVRSMSALSKGGVIVRKIDRPPMSLRLQALLAPDGCVLGEESPFFDAPAAKMKRLAVRRIPSAMLASVSFDS